MKAVHTFSIAIAILSLSLSCSSERDKVFTIGVSQCSEDLWRETVNNEIRREASFRQTMNVIIKSVKDDSDAQIRDIKDLVSQGVDLLVVSPNESKTLTPIISEVFKKGIPVILLDRRISSEDYSAYVGVDNRMLGSRIGSYVTDILHGSGNIVVIRGLEGSSADDERYEGFKESIGSASAVHIVAESYSDFLKDTAMKNMDAILHDFRDDGPEIDLVFALNDQMAIGASEAYRLHPGAKVPTIIGIDAIAGHGGGIEAINNGEIDASFMYPTGGDKVVEVAWNILTGKSYDKENFLNTAVVDKTNVRIIRLQNEQISQQQEKVDILSTQLSVGETALTRQQAVINTLTVSIVLISIFIIILFLLVRNYRRLNRTLSQKNEEIKTQMGIMKSQQEQLSQISRSLEDATQAKLMFFTDISHEFKTPLTLILGPVEELLGRTTDLNPQERNALEIVRKNGLKLMGLLNQILEFRTYENGQMKLNREVECLDTFIRSTESLFVPNMNRKGVSHEFVTDGKDYTISFDKDKIDKIYFNLLSNALKFVNVGGVIRTELRLSDGMVMMSVFNSGSFIPPEKIGEVFKRFYHIDDEHENSGIGLALSKALVEAHGGYISVESKQGEGARFTVNFPLVREAVKDSSDKIEIFAHDYVRKQLELDNEQLSNDPDALIPNAPDERKPTVLVIEDNADMRQYISLVLSSSYNVIDAANGRKGVEMAVRYLPALVITDILMPVMNGFDVCKTLKTNIITKNIPIICLTACATDEQKILSYESGSDAYLTKPFNANVLRTRIAKLIEKNAEISESISSEIFPGTNLKSLGDKQRELVEKFRDYVERHLTENISIDSIAEELGLSRSGLYRQMKVITDYNPVDIISLIKLKKGIKYMLVERKTVAEAAFDSGFSSPSYFTKTFIKYYKEKPSDYIKKYTK